MKKTIHVLISKLNQNFDGTITGGFASIKGGRRFSTNDTCSGSNGGCTNKVDCTNTTNTGDTTCTNSGKCHH